MAPFHKKGTVYSWPDGVFLPETVGTVPVWKFSGQIRIWNLIRIVRALVRRKERLIYALIMKKKLGQSDADLRTLVYKPSLHGSTLSLKYVNLFG
jgi:hypothetical protein